MKQNYLKKFTVRLAIVVALVCAIVIIHSCRKDQREDTTPSTTLSQTDLIQLQLAYKIGTSAGTNLSLNPGTTGTSSSGSTGFPALIHNLNVQWDKYVINNRADNSRVVEFDMQPDTGLTLLKQLNTGDTVYYRNKTCAGFIKLGNGKQFNFFMKVIEDFSLTHKSVIGQLHYRQIPATFSGEIFYYSLNKTFINGYRFTNGKVTGTVIVPPPAANVTQTTAISASG